MSSQNERPFLSLRPTLATSHHSQLRQEHDYLQQCIASEERNREGLTKKLKQAEAKLQDMRSIESSPESIKAQKKSNKKIRSLLNKNARTWDILSERLRALMLEMNRLEDLQWRRNTVQVSFPSPFTDYQAASVPSLPNWSPFPPMSMMYTVPTGFVPPQPNFSYPVDQMMINMVPQRSVMRPLQYSPSPLVYYQPGQSFGGFGNLEMSPTDTTVSSCTFSPWAANPPTSFPVVPGPTPVVDVFQAFNNLDISDQQGNTVPRSPRSV